MYSIHRTRLCSDNSLYSYLLVLGSKVDRDWRFYSDSLNLWNSSTVRNSKWLVNKFRKVDLFPISGEDRRPRILLGPLKRANLNHWTWTKSINTVILSVTHHRQNPLDSIEGFNVVPQPLQANSEIETWLSYSSTLPDTLRSSSMCYSITRRYSL
jgi:hypothetical protein